MDQYLNEPLIYSLSGSSMFQIANGNTSDVSITIDFDPDALPKNGLELFLKVSQLHKYANFQVVYLTVFRHHKSMIQLNMELQH